ncbi:hypothetical protein RF11_08634 [Thelohanellus kitauei]|uniref:Uncharacterized protein n=1 Tax=Thelohanellus kitauei TaxID=669202 RepID=A0A0C2MBZ0_THEKT|nr:hypothetical protein RF11_08634 [Thelohanellus kitauei]
MGLSIERINVHDILTITLTEMTSVFQIVIEVDLSSIQDKDSICIAFQSLMRTQKQRRINARIQNLVSDAKVRLARIRNVQSIERSLMPDIGSTHFRIISDHISDVFSRDRCFQKIVELIVGQHSSSENIFRKKFIFGQ